jgi:hypothetical protein
MEEVLFPYSGLVWTMDKIPVGWFGQWMKNSVYLWTTD